jgi:site-specific DNA-methyltransferase (adenine-specific)
LVNAISSVLKEANSKKINSWCFLELTHNAMYEIEIPLIFILLTSKINESVLDIFNGTGTTGIASYLNHRLYTGIEFSENYINISIARYKAILELDSN